MTDETKLLAQQPRKIVAWCAGAGLAVTIVTAVAWAATRPNDDTELAQWLPGITGAATLVAAVVAAIFAAGAFRLEYRREIRLLDQNERAQAEAFVGWARTPGFGRRADGDVVTYTLANTEVHLQNASNLPIFDVSGEIRITSGHSELHGRFVPGGIDVALVPPGQTEVRALKPISIALVRPSDLDGNTPVPTAVLALAMQYRDTAGRHWRRHGDGTVEMGEGDLRF